MGVTHHIGTNINIKHKISRTITAAHPVLNCRLHEKEKEWTDCKANAGGGKMSLALRPASMALRRNSASKPPTQNNHPNTEHCTALGAGLRVIAFVCDGASSNRKLLKMFRKGKDEITHKITNIYAKGCLLGDISCPQAFLSLSTHTKKFSPQIALPMNWILGGAVPIVAYDKLKKYDPVQSQLLNSISVYIAADYTLQFSTRMGSVWLAIAVLWANIMYLRLYPQV